MGQNYLNKIIMGLNTSLKVELIINIAKFSVQCEIMY